MAQDLAEGRLVRLLDAFRPVGHDVFAVYPPSRHAAPQGARGDRPLRRELGAGAPAVSPPPGCRGAPPTGPLRAPGRRRRAAARSSPRPAPASRARRRPPAGPAAGKETKPADRCLSASVTKPCPPAWHPRARTASTSQPVNRAARATGRRPTKGRIAAALTRADPAIDRDHAIVPCRRLHQDDVDRIEDPGGDADRLSHPGGRGHVAIAPRP